MNKTSSLEKRIISILNSEGIKFIKEKAFKDLKNGYYRFDFFIPSNNIAIEIQGQQHYQYTSIFYKHRSDFTKAQERDRIKIQYCLAHDIKLYCIPFWEIDKINFSYQIFNDKFLAKNKYHNDIVWREHKKN